MSGLDSHTSVTETFTGRCPFCGANLETRGAWAGDQGGATVRCPKCAAEIFINDSTLEFGAPFDEDATSD